MILMRRLIINGKDFFHVQTVYNLIASNEFVHADPMALIIRELVKYGIFCCRIVGIQAARNKITL